MFWALDLHLKFYIITFLVEQKDCWKCQRAAVINSHHWSVMPPQYLHFLLPSHCCLSFSLHQRRLRSCSAGLCGRPVASPRPCPLSSSSSSFRPQSAASMTASRPPSASPPSGPSGGELPVFLNKHPPWDRVYLSLPSGEEEKCYMSLCRMRKQPLCLWNPFKKNSWVNSKMYGLQAANKADFFFSSLKAWQFGDERFFAWQQNYTTSVI